LIRLSDAPSRYLPLLLVILHIDVNVIEHIEGLHRPMETVRAIATPFNETVLSALVVVILES